MVVFGNANKQTVRDALDDQGYTVTRGTNIDNLNATVSSRSTQTSLDAQAPSELVTGSMAALVINTETDVLADTGSTANARSVSGEIDITNIIAGDTLEVRLYTRVISGGALVLVDLVTFTGLQSSPNVEFKDVITKYGIRITAKQTAGTGRVLTRSFYAKTT